MLIGETSLCLALRVGRILRIRGEAELVRDESSQALWPRPDDWGLVAGLRGMELTEAWSCPDEVQVETRHGDWIRVEGANCFDIIPAGAPGRPQG